jgi:hypothetical protein
MGSSLGFGGISSSFSAAKMMKTSWKLSHLLWKELA